MNNGTDLDFRAFTWDTSGAVEFGNLSTNGGSTSTFAYGTNGTGGVVGRELKYNGSTYQGDIAVRWDSATKAVIALGTIGPDYQGGPLNHGSAINRSGMVTGCYGYLYGSNNLGYRPVRWDANGTPTELGNLGTLTNGGTISQGNAINDAGTVVGYANKYSGNTSLGSRAVRWAAGSTNATELGNLGADINGVTTASASVVNASGVTAGTAEKYSGTGTDLGPRAVRWEADGTATELGAIGSASNGFTNSSVVGINSAGTIVGTVAKYVSNQFRGNRAVRWAAGSTVPEELGNIGTDAFGEAEIYPNSINSAGLMVGYGEKWVNGTNLGNHAILWKADGVAVDLNDLIDPGSGWTLTEADFINDNGWISGYGQFDPDGSGGAAPYTRAYLIQVPEPAGFTVLLLGCSLLCRRRIRG